MKWHEWPFVWHAAGGRSVLQRLRQPIRFACWTHITCLAVTPGTTQPLCLLEPSTAFHTTFVLHTTCQHSDTNFSTPSSVSLCNPAPPLPVALSYVFNFVFFHVQQFPPVSPLPRPSHKPLFSFALFFRLQFPNLFFKKVAKSVSAHISSPSHTRRLSLTVAVSLHSARLNLAFHFTSLYTQLPSPLAAHIPAVPNGTPSPTSPIFCAPYLALPSVRLIFHTTVPSNQTCYSQVK